jgi:hypothetical protein
VTITIDSTLFQNDTIEIDGLLGIYSQKYIRHEPYILEDSLVLELKIQQKQTFSLEPGQYFLTFKPSDTTQNTNWQHFYPQRKEVHLNPFFFNQAYPSFIGSLDRNDYFVINSVYHGPTTMETAIPIYTLTIKRKRKKFYALFSESAAYEQDIRFLPSTLMYQYDPSQIKLTDDYIQLSEKDIEMICQFEKNLSTHALYMNTGNVIPTSKTVIHTKNGVISFLSHGYLSEILWKKLNK